MSPEVIHTGNFLADAVKAIASRIVAAQESGGIFRLSLCGGSTPKPVYRALAEESGIDWERVLLTFGDERAVPPEDESSNYRMVRESLLDPAGIPRGNVMRICGEMDPAEAARRYEGQFRKLAQIAGETAFVHDLVLLGMGEDGHTASLFPDTAALEERERWVVPNFVPVLDSWRITTTYPLIAAAREVLFLVEGERKRAMLEEVLQPGARFPASLVRAGTVRWLVGT